MYSLYLVSNRPYFFKPIVKSLSPERITYFDGTGYPSFSKLVNTCVSNSYTETVIIMGDRVSPTTEHVKKTINLLERGYAFVGLYRFGFFGFKKELFRRIGMLDERYVGGGYEDDDFYIRLVENNLAMYVSEEMPYRAGISRWNYDLSRPHYYKKWRYDEPSNTIYRMLEEPKYNYNLGPSVPTNFLSAREFSFSPLPHSGRFFYVNIKSAI